MRVGILTHEALAECPHKQPIDTLQRVLYTIFPTTLKKVICCKNIYYLGAIKLMVRLLI
jgi:hypothetical protein